MSSLKHMVGDMSTITFLKHVLAEEGLYCLFAARAHDGLRAQQLFTSLEDMHETAQQLDEQGYDVYFATGTFREKLKKGARAASNVQLMRSFFIDLDCGEGKPFPSQQTALAALRAFCSKTTLPKPTLVNSGRGIHAYWTLQHGIERDVWQPIAEKFKAMCLGQGLTIDPVVPADSARVLRYPGTRNFKDSPPKEVAVLGDVAERMELEAFEYLVDKHAPDITMMSKKPKRLQDDPLTSTLAGNTTSRFKTILQKCKEGTGCAQITYAAANQEVVEEPLWRAALSIAVNCVDGEKAIHIISKNHPSYDPEQTQEKANLTAGPYHCASFDSVRPGGCEGCPHWGKLTSPIQLGKEIIRATEEDNVVFDKPERMEMAALQEYTIPDLPYPYFRGKNGGVYIESEGKDGEGEELLIYPHDLYIVRRVVDPEAGDSIIVRVHLPKDGVREFIVPLVAATSRDELRKYYARYGITVMNWEALMAYTTRWTAALTQQSAADVSRKQFGWTDEDFSGFALGRMLITKDRVDINSPSNRTAALFPMFEPRGTLEQWKKNMAFFNRDGFESYQYVIGTAFGSVLTRLTAINGSMFHFYSKDSGLGKTTAMFAAASLWGCPAKFVKYERDTTNDKMLYAESLKDLPLYLDELTNMAPKDASDLIYQIPSGMQRGRMASGANESRWRGDPWRMICVSTGNTSLIAKVSAYKDAPLAEIQRVLEYCPDKMTFKDKAETDQFAKSVNENYGHAGVLYLQYLMNNMDSVRATLKKVQQAIDDKVQLTAQNRFWSAQAACVITGLLIAKKLDLINFNIKKLTEWVVWFLSTYKAEDMMSFKSDAQSVISEYYYDNVNDFLRIRGDGNGNGKQDILDHLVVPDALPRGSLLGRFELDTNTLYLLPKPFREWCTERQIDFSWVIKGLRNEPTCAKTMSKRLGAGTKLNLPSVNVLRINGVSWLKDDDAEEIEDQTPEKSQAVA